MCALLQLNYKDFGITNKVEVIEQTFINEKMCVTGISRSYLDACPLYVILAISWECTMAECIDC